MTTKISSVLFENKSMRVAWAEAEDLGGGRRTEDLVPVLMGYKDYITCG